MLHASKLTGAETCFKIDELMIKLATNEFVPFRFPQSMQTRFSDWSRKSLVAGGENKAQKDLSIGTLNHIIFGSKFDPR